MKVKVMSFEDLMKALEKGELPGSEDGEEIMGATSPDNLGKLLHESLNQDLLNILQEAIPEDKYSMIQVMAACAYLLGSMTGSSAGIPTSVCMMSEALGDFIHDVGHFSFAKQHPELKSQNAPSTKEKH